MGHSGWPLGAVWSLDDSKLGQNSRVFECLRHAHFSIGFEHNILDQEDRKHFLSVSFSPDGRYLAYGGDNNKITPDNLMLLRKKLNPSLRCYLSSTSEDYQSELLSFLNIDTTNSFAHPGGDGIVEDGDNDPHVDFFSPSQCSLTPAPSDPSKKRRLRNIFSALSVLRAPSLVSARANSKPTAHTTEGKVGGEEDGKDVEIPQCSAIITPCAAEENNDKGKHRNELLAATETTPPDGPSPTASPPPSLTALTIASRGNS
ncbi:hypothetical protein K503DRAFT_869992 [Rhizopogon vinicolor AM-OR11-026]|uniref:WD40 repeat-like protein n=1 Tax=Rhizopogon vinicolor AM-OR11-026 TaxID=1314800 RepID=A0A1B7MJE4_9AGAM|nr:hypothetical protein K503DRAFT_869992 [Rhizopogon vinicolor AM-OR11-026]